MCASLFGNVLSFWNRLLLWLAVLSVDARELQHLSRNAHSGEFLPVFRFCRQRVLYLSSPAFSTVVCV